jgi:tetratricopeptide (TPR) repeat protein
MARIPAVKEFLAIGFLTCVGAVYGQGPSAVDLLKYQPTFKEIAISTPEQAKIAACAVEALPAGGPAGYLLLDEKKQPLRKFFSTNGKSINAYAYYREGVEVYREIDTDGNGKVDQFRWLGTAGSKWGVDMDQDGTIDAWRAISAEEAAFEAFQALKTGNFPRLKALLIDANELTQLKLPSADAQAIAARLQKAQKDFSEVLSTKYPNMAAYEFLKFDSTTHGEAPAPSLYLADSLGAAGDVLKWHHRSILVQSKADKRTDFISMPDLIQVGQAWRLTGVPGADGPADPPVAQDPKVREKLDVLADLDTKNSTLAPKDGAKYVAYITNRIAAINDILQVAPSKDREMWYRQLCDNLSNAFLAGDSASLDRLSKLHEQFEKAVPGSNLAAYAKYRHVVADYTVKLQEAPQKWQEPYQKALTDFVKQYDKSEDTPYALYQLAMGCEFTGRDEEAKRWYRQLHTDFPGHMHAEDAKGSIRRLDLVKNALELSGPELGTSQNFDIKQLKGKIVVVYYWASYASVCVGDFARLKKTLADYPGDVALVTVSLDDNAGEAQKFLAQNGVSGTHLYVAPPQGMGGMRSPLAVQYGINGIPQMFVVGKDGLVTNNRAQVGDLENEIRKLK